jgi:hypothetical protein
VAFDRVANILHVGWTANAGGSYTHAYHQTFDVTSKQWIGTPTQVAAGYGANNQFQVQDVAVTPKGAVALAISGHRSGGYGLSSWGTGLLVKAAGATSFPPVSTANPNLAQMNSSSGTGCNLQVFGEEIHCVFRDTPGGYGPAYSVFDVTTMQYVAKAVPIGPGNNTTPPAGAGSIYSFLMDRAGGKYVLWPSGIVSGSQIAGLHLTYAPPGKGAQNADWTDTLLFNDPATSPNGKKITGGNTGERWFTLSFAGDDSVNVLYSKPSEDWQNLYWEVWKNGAQVVGPIAPVTSTSLYKFEWVTGFRNYQVQSAGMFLVWGEHDQTAMPPQSGTVSFWRMGATGRSVEFGTACQGTLSAAPRLRCTSHPSAGSSINVVFDQNPASANCMVVIGTQPLASPLNLGFMGAPTCALDIDFPIIVPMAVNAQGELSVPWAIPSATAAGTKVYVQNFVLAPGANAAGAVTSNALAFTF